MAAHGSSGFKQYHGLLPSLRSGGCLFHAINIVLERVLDIAKQRPRLDPREVFNIYRDRESPVCTG